MRQAQAPGVLAGLAVVIVFKLRAFDRIGGLPITDSRDREGLYLRRDIGVKF